MRPILGAAGAFALILIWGCAPDSATRTTYSSRDSAGVQIVTSHAAAWGADEGWTVSSEPAVRIGVLEGSDRYQFDDIVGVTRLSDGRIVVLNGGDSELRFYDESGQFIHAVGGPGEGPGELNRITGLHPQPGDSLLVSMRADTERAWFTPEGEFVRLERMDYGGLSQFLGQVWGCPRRPGLLPDGSFVACVGQAPERNPVPEAPRVAHYLVRVPYDLSWADTLGVLYGPELSVNLGSRGTQLAAGGNPTRIHLGHPSFFEIDVMEDDRGHVMSIRYPNGLSAVTEADIAAYEQYLEEWEASRPPGARYAPIEDRLTAPRKAGFTELHVDEPGSLWAIEYSVPWEETRSALVFAPEGHLLGRVELPDGLEVMEIGSEYLLGIWRDPLDVEYVQLHELHRE